MWIVRLALRRPYTFVVGALLVIIFGVVASACFFTTGMKYRLRRLRSN